MIETVSVSVSVSVSWFGDQRYFHQLDRCNQSQYLKKSMIVNESSVVDPDSTTI
ncbi:hypothetical protein Ccrd_015727, partial [Cynara cardunculus var. scolymus]